MAKLLSHLTQELESELSRAIKASNEGYPQHLNDMRDSYESITDEDVDVISEALWEGQQDGRQAKERDDSAADDSWVDEGYVREYFQRHSR
jgi:hypothetical protein